MATAAAGRELFGHFRGAAAHYLAGRPPDAGLLIRRVAELVGLARPHAVLDLACGPGMQALAFAPLAGSVVAMDHEPDMRRTATEVSAGIGNIRVAAGRSHDLSPAVGRFRLVVMQRSFHWMDRADTYETREFAAASLLDRALSMSSTSPDRLGDKAAALAREITALIREIALDGRLSETVVSTALIGRRPGKETLP